MVYILKNPIREGSFWWEVNARVQDILWKEIQLHSRLQRLREKNSLSRDILYWIKIQLALILVGIDLIPFRSIPLRYLLFPSHSHEWDLLGKGKKLRRIQE